MNALLPIFEQALITVFMSKKAPFSHNKKFGLGFFALSGLLFFTALIFAIIAGYGWLLTEYEQPIAALITSGFILGLSLIFSLIGLSLSKKKSPPPISTDEITEYISMITEIIGEDLSKSISDNPKTAVLIASAAGFLASQRLN